jgi:DNA-binding transcriptional MerR regulator
MESGFRLYTEEDVQRIQLVRQLQEMLGFSVRNQGDGRSRRGAQPFAHHSEKCPQKSVRQLQHAIEVTESQLLLITQKIEKLNEMRGQWEQKIQHYRNHQGQAEVQIAQGEAVEAATR